MDAIECIRTRYSVRRFTDEPVGRELLEEAIAAAMRSPSYKNSQPWEVAVVSGKKKAGLSEVLLGLLGEGRETSADIPKPDAWPPQVQRRIEELMKTRSKLAGMDLTDPVIVKKSRAANFRFYGAPCGIFLYHDSALGKWSILDMGMFAQSLMLALHARGLGSVPQAFLTDYAREVKEFLGIDASKRLVLGLSVGYPDAGHPANSYRTQRAEPSEVIKWIE